MGQGQITGPGGFVAPPPPGAAPAGSTASPSNAPTGAPGAPGGFVAPPSPHGVGSSTAAPSPGSSSGGHGVLGFLGHLASDAKGAIEGLPTGVEQTVHAITHEPLVTRGPLLGGHHGDRIAGIDALHPGKAADEPFGTELQGIGKQTAGYYSPLFHGKFGQFGHELYAHPLQPILDAATIATLGGAGAAKAGEILDRAGMLSDTSRLATLGKASDLKVPDFGAGEDIVVKQSSRNPVIRVRQETVNNLLNKLPSETPVFGSTARAVRALSREPERVAARLQGDAQKATQTFGRLTKPERVAWHLKARGLTPAQYADHLATTGAKVSPATLKALSSKEVARLVANPSENLRAALDAGRILSDKLTALRVAGGHIDELTALESPYRHLRFTGGAKVTENGIEGGKSVEQLMKEIDAQGGEHPFHVPDSAHTPGLRGRFSSRPSGFAAPEQGVKQSRGILFSKGLINFNDNSLVRDYRSFASQARAQLLHDELVKHAAIVPKGEPIPHGYEELKLNRGQASAPYTLRAAAPLEHELSQPTLRDRLAELSRQHLDEMNPEEPHRLVVPSQVRKLVEDGASSRPHGTLRKLAFDQPTNVWKHLILGLRPAFFGNITIGNSILGTLQMAPGRFGIAGWLNQVAPGAERLFGPKLSEETMQHVFPEQAYGTFGHDVGFSPNAGLRAGQKLYQGVMPATIAYENVLRRAMAEGWAKADPEVQALMRHNGGDVNAALREIAQTKPQIIDGISRRVDDALGNYRTYNRLERALKAVVPFYGWNRHLTSSVVRLALERPQVLDALYQTGQEGKPLADAILAALPKYLQGSLGVHLPTWLGGEPGMQQLLTMQSLNPFNTIVDEGDIAAAPFHKAGASSDAFPLNPYAEAAIEQLTGTNLLTGHPLRGNALANEAQHLTPLQGILHDLIYGRHPSPTATNQNNELGQLLRYLGLPVENVQAP